MTILDKIVEYKYTEVEAAKKKKSIGELKDSQGFSRACYSLKESFADKTRNGIISEFKRASPSKGLINGTSTVQDVVSAYQKAKASAVSVLTDSLFFQGSLTDLEQAREVLEIPLLRKDFIVDPYQITEAKAYGADVILLIAAYLDESQLQEYAAEAHELGLSVLLEVHNAEELEKSLHPHVDALGVNNRNLKDFSVQLETSYDLVDKIPERYTKVSESGISHPETIIDLRNRGFQGFLIGENFMKHESPEQSIAQFVTQI